MTDTRIIIFHKHPVSAKVRFVMQAYGGVCGFEPLPDLATVLDDDTPLVDENVVSHPKPISLQAEKALSLEADSLETEGGYLQRVEIPGGEVKVYLAGIKGHDAPETALAEQGASLKLITELRGLPPAEMELLRRAYVAIMEG